MKKIKFITMGIICSVLCTIVFLLCFSIYLVNNNINETIIPIFIMLFFMLAILFGTIITTRKIKEKGAFYGFSMSIIYICILYVISSIYIGDFTISKQSVFMILFGLVTGIIGGIIGVNIK